MTSDMSSEGERIRVGAKTTERLYAVILLTPLLRSTLQRHGEGGREGGMKNVIKPLRSSFNGGAGRLVPVQVLHEVFEYIVVSFGQKL